MRIAVIASDPVAHAAAETLLADGGTAVDAVLAGLVAGATRASASSLMGSAGILLVGPGVGSHFVDGRARAPGLGEKRPRTPDVAPTSWRAVVPGLLAGVLATSTRFGTAPLSTVVGAAVSALRDSAPDASVLARIRFLRQFARTGLSALEGAGVVQAILQTVGPTAGGVFTVGDLVPIAAPVYELRAYADAGDEAFLPEVGQAHHSHQRATPPPAVTVECVVAMDIHGVTALASWVVAPDASPLPGVEGLALAGLLALPVRGVPRWRAGAMVSCPLPLAVLVRGGRTWAGVGVSGTGDVDTARDVTLNARMHAVGMSLRVGDATETTVTDALAHWAIRDSDGHDVRTAVATVGRAAPEP